MRQKFLLLTFENVIKLWTIIIEYLINTLEITKIEYEKQRETVNNSSEVEEKISSKNKFIRKEKMMQGKWTRKFTQNVIRNKVEI